MIAAVTALVAGFSTASSALANDGGTATAILQDNMVKINVTDTGTTDIGEVRVRLDSAGASATGCSPTPCGTNNTANAEFGVTPALTPGHSGIFAIDTTPSPYTGKVDIVLSFSSGGTQLIPMVPVQSGSTCTPALTITKRLLSQHPSNSYIRALGYDFSIGVDEATDFLLLIENTTNCEATNVVVQDPLPAGLALGTGSFSPAFQNKEIDDISQVTRADGGSTVTFKIPAIAPHAKVELTLITMPNGAAGGSLQNQASIFAPVAVSSNVLKLLVTGDPSDRHTHADGIGAGGLSDDGEVPPSYSQRAMIAAGPNFAALSRVAGVDIAVLRLPAPTGGKKCVWLTRRGSFKSQSESLRSAFSPYPLCGQPLWLRAKGKHHWAYHFKNRLPRGRYVLFVRAVNRAGAFIEQFSRAKHNMVRFRVS